MCVDRFVKNRMGLGTYTEIAMVTYKLRPVQNVVVPISVTLKGVANQVKDAFLLNIIGVSLCQSFAL